MKNLTVSVKETETEFGTKKQRSKDRGRKNRKKGWETIYVKV